MLSISDTEGGVVTIIRSETGSLCLQTDNPFSATLHSSLSYDNRDFRERLRGFFII